LWNTASTIAVIGVDWVLDIDTLTEWYVLPNSAYFAGVGKVNVCAPFPDPLPDVVTVTVAVAEPERPAKVFAETTRVQVPFARLFTDTM